MLGTSTWREQFIDALTVNAGSFFFLPFCLIFFSFYLKSRKYNLESMNLIKFTDDDDEGGDDEDGEEGNEVAIRAPPSCCDYFIHFMTMPWKLIFATIPPTGSPNPS